MVRNYVRKTNRGDYSKETFEEAIEEIKAGRINASRASKKYSIPLNTILDHLKGRRGIKSKSFGRSTAIPIQDEKRLADSLLKLEKYGFGLSRKEVLELVGQFVKTNKIKTPFKDGVPGEDWFLSFAKRNNLSLRNPQSVEIARRKSCDPFTIDQYFTMLEKTVVELGLENKPTRIWNLDETSFCTDPSKTKVVSSKNFPSTCTVSAPGRENIIEEKESKEKFETVSNAISISSKDDKNNLEIKRRMTKQKQHKGKCRTLPSSPITTSTKEDEDILCSICKCDFQYYINKKDWIQCVICRQWVCGICNKDSKKQQYECERCLDDD